MSPRSISRSLSQKLKKNAPSTWTLNAAATGSSPLGTRTKSLYILARSSRLPSASRLETPEPSLLSKASACEAKRATSAPAISLEREEAWR